MRQYHLHHADVGPPRRSVQRRVPALRVDAVHARSVRQDHRLDVGNVEIGVVDGRVERRVDSLRLDYVLWWKHGDLRRSGGTVLTLDLYVASVGSH